MGSPSPDITKDDWDWKTWEATSGRAAKIKLNLIMANSVLIRILIISFTACIHRARVFMRIARVVATAK